MDMIKTTCALCFATLGSILAAPMLGADPASPGYATVWLAAAAVISGLTTLVAPELRLRRSR